MDLKRSSEANIEQRPLYNRRDVKSVGIRCLICAFESQPPILTTVHFGTSITLPRWPVCHSDFAYGFYSTSRECFNMQICTLHCLFLLIYNILKMDIPAPLGNAALSVTSHCCLNILPFADPHKQDLGLRSCHQKLTLP